MGPESGLFEAPKTSLDFFWQTVQESIRFTHCKLDYNMGWLVQAEAHPGALFRAFRKVILDRPQAWGQDW